MLFHIWSFALSLSFASTQPQVIGGSVIPTGEPKLGAIGSLEVFHDGKWYYGCAATAINDRFAITAAHCLTDDLVIYFGVDAQNPTPERLRKVIRVNVHPQYGSGSRNKHDMAVLEFAGGVPPGVVPMGLAPDKLPVLKGQEVLLAGYGDGLLKGGQLKVDNPQFSPSEATLDQTHGVGACYGDSGGPVILTVGGKKYLWAIVSRGRDPGPSCVPGFSIVTLVNHDLPWLKRILQGKSQSL